jgi:hypothetical protein
MPVASVMPKLLVRLTWLALPTSLAAQSQPADPVQMVGRAEQLCAGEGKEQGVLLLWDALDELSQQAESPARTAAIASARTLLAANDPLQSARFAAFTTAAKLQVDLAAAYRGNRWLETAAERLQFADRFDPEASVRERQLLATVRPKTATAAKGNPWFRKEATDRVVGPWQSQPYELHCDAREGADPSEWILDKRHEDCELSVEFGGGEATGLRDAGFALGLDADGPSYQVKATCRPIDKGGFWLVIWEVRGRAVRKLTDHFCQGPATAGDFHSLVVRVHGDLLRAQLDGCAMIEARTTAPPRGHFGLVIGTGEGKCEPLTFRKLRMSELPADEPRTPEEVARIAAEAMSRIGVVIDTAKTLLTRKAKGDAESAAEMLRQAVSDLAVLSPGTLRDNLAQSADKLLLTADLLQPRRKKAGQEGAKALLAVADRYQAAGWHRAAHRLVLTAAGLDADSCRARLESPAVIELRGFRTPQ